MSIWVMKNGVMLRKTVLKDKSHIQEVVNALKICTIDSILPYDSNTVVKNMKFVMLKSGGNIEVAWFNEDKIW